MYLVGQILFKPVRGNVSDIFRQVNWYACFSSWEGVLGHFDGRDPDPDQVVVICVPSSVVPAMLGSYELEDGDDD